MAKTLGISATEFVRDHCTEEDGVFRLRARHKSGACRFLSKDNKCVVYEGRPTQCRTWPFWPENMNTKVWDQEIASFCPGVGKGKEGVDAASIKKQLKDQFDSEIEIFDPDLYDVIDAETFDHLLESIDQLQS